MIYSIRNDWSTRVPHLKVGSHKQSLLFRVKGRFMRIGFLNVFQVNPQLQSDQSTYKVLMQEYFDLCHFLSEPLVVYEVSQGQYPKSTTECDGWLIGGSPASCYEQTPWIEWLSGFVNQLHQAKLKLMGICFGHQMIAHSLGGSVKLASSGWGLGVKHFEFHTLPRWFDVQQHGPWADGTWTEKCALIHSHQDQVLQLPRGATLLAGNAYCPVQSYVMGEHIFTLQGHPEFTSDYALQSIEKKRSLIEPADIEIAKASLSGQTHEKEIARMIRAFFVNEKTQ